MTADPVPVLKAMFDGIDADVSVRFDSTTLPRIRLEPTGGTDEINGWHDQALVTVRCFASTYALASALASEARAALTTGEHGDAIVTRATSTPFRYDDGSTHTPPCGVVAFTARVWLHPA